MPDDKELELHDWESLGIEHIRCRHCGNELIGMIYWGPNNELYPGKCSAAKTPEIWGTTEDDERAPQMERENTELSAKMDALDLDRAILQANPPHTIQLKPRSLGVSILQQARLNNLDFSAKYDVMDAMLHPEKKQVHKFDTEADAEFYFERVKYWTQHYGRDS